MPSIFPLKETLITLFPIILLLLIHMAIKKSTNHKTPRHPPPLPPGPPGWPILGCLPELWRNRPSHRWVRHIMESLGTDIACFRVANNSYVVAVKSPEIAREFLKKHDAVFVSRPETMATRILSSGFITAGVGPWGDQWKKMRRVMACHVFNPTNVKWLLHKRNLEADNLVSFIYSQCSKTSSKGELVDVRTAARQYSCGVMRRMMFNKRYFGKGRAVGGPGFEEEEHIEALFSILKHLYAFSVSDYFPWLEILDLDGHKKKVLDAMRVIAKYHDPIVNDRLQRGRDRGANKEPEDLLDVFISLKDSDGNPLLSDDEVRAQSMEPFLTLDNPFNVAEWGLSEMLNRPETLERAMKELDIVVGKERLLQESDIPNLPFLTACARETLRLHPVGPFNLPHTSTSDCIVAGYFIPKGTSVILDRVGLGRNPNTWEDPMRFDPTRHLLEGGRVTLAEDELRFVTFSVGRRGCTNVGLGSNMIMMLFGRILQAFSWEIPSGLDKIDLSEGDSLFKAQPLFALAKPRLNDRVYQSLLE